MTVTDGTETMDVELGRTGNYKFFVPVDEKVTLNITSPCYMTKQVLLDTHNAPSTDGIISPAPRRSVSTWNWSASPRGSY
ncbi:MAG: hypothetical protein IPG10_20720 [Flavobacteriales bacterium]|nr:hypothetical protein [Flavobacteriales bacterium]